MALTAEQQSVLDLHIAQQQINDAAEVARREHEKTMENLRHQNNLAIAQAQAAAQAAIVAKQAKIEAVRLAKETLIENRRNQPVDAREISSAEIASFADTLVNYVNN